MFERKGLLPVSGKLDFVAGGTPVLDESLDALLGNVAIPELYRIQARNMVEELNKRFPDGLIEKNLEIKSVATFGFDKIEKTGKPLNGHDVQAFHYAKNTGRPTALVYLCRDDLRMYEFQIDGNDPVLLKKYLDKIERITKHYESNIEPQPEPLILYESGRFSKNLGIEYSPFLKDIYGFDEPRDYSDKIKGMIGKWNRVLGRIAKGAKMTPKNEEILKHIETFGFDLAIIKKDIADLASQGLVLEEEEAEE
jgi:hypothetical protein